MNKLLDHIRSLTHFTDESWLLLQKALSKIEINKNDFLRKESQLWDSLFFIEKGCCRSYYFHDGTEKNINFFFENDIVGHLSRSGSFEKSTYNVVACEPLTAVEIDKHTLVEIAQKNIEIERMGRAFIQAFSTKQEEFSKIVRFYSAEERLTYIEKYHQEFVERIPLTQLASFLGVTRETLSRIRKQRSRS